MATATTTKWLRVSSRNPCSICGKPDWCLVSADGKSAICARIQSETLAGNAGWLHRLDGSIQRPPLPQPRVAKQSIKAPIEVLNNTYQALLSELSLSQAHRDNLNRRGLTDAQISALQYKTMPKNVRAHIIRHLSTMNVTFAGVPGFFNNDSGHWQLAGAPGICIPVRDLEGQISGIQIRRDNGNPKYVWLSSRDKPNGCGSGSPVHVARPAGADTTEVWITEGPLKADIASMKLKRILLAIPGVSTWNGVIPIICNLRPQAVVVSLDMDHESNPTVATHRNFLITRLLRFKLKVYVANWNPQYKGIDDLLATSVVHHG